MRLLEILGQQLERLINEGKPDLHSLFTLLSVESLMSEEECRELMATFALDAVSYLYEMERNPRADADISGMGGDTEGVLECCCWPLNKERQHQSLRQAKVRRRRWCRRGGRNRVTMQYV
jgi:hypothetical protein